MSHAASHGHELPQLRAENISLPSGAGKTAGMGLLAAGAVLLGITAVAGFLGVGDVWARHALAALLVGGMGVLTLTLGSTFLIMIMHLTNAGWASTVRRQLENVAAFLPIAFLLTFAVPVVDFIAGGKLYGWMNPAAYSDYLLVKKSVYFFFPLSLPEDGSKAFPLFFMLRGIFYGVMWTYLSRRLISLSRQQDETGDVNLSAQARRTSAWGILVLALTTAFAGFDWLMTLDFRFFSTMWGVYIFAGSMYGATALLAIILANLRGKGKLEGAVTEEHFHDLGKLMFSFTVFWAYIAFSQYFLIWYSNIPEETSWYVFRNEGGYGWLFNTLIFGHFVLPFLILVCRPVKRSMKLLAFMGGWMLVLHFLDLVYIIRPMAYADGRGIGVEQPAGVGAWWLDALAILGAVLMLAGFLVKRIPSAPLVPAKDPWIHESLEHKNYV